MALMGLVFALVCGLAAAQQAQAQNRRVVSRLVEYGQMSRSQAVRLVRHVSKVLAKDASKGGKNYNRIRKAVNRAVFGDQSGPGETRAKYFTRLDRVLSAMHSGLDLRMLEELFQAGENASVLCANDFDLTVGQCDALIAAATKQQSALPYTPPDDGKALRRELGQAGVSKRTSATIAEHFRETMLDVPGNLTQNERGRGLLSLLKACPGGLDSRESQVRAWHVGPTPGLTQCMVQTLIKRGGEQRAQQALRNWFGMPSSAAQAAVEWAASESSPAPAVANRGAGAASTQSSRAPATPQPRGRGQRAAQGSAQSGQGAAEQLREKARKHYRAKNYRKALQAYRNATQLEPGYAGSYSGMGACQLALGNPQKAVRAYQHAVQLAPNHAGYRAALGRALSEAGDRSGAIQALRAALRIDPNHRSARQGLAALGGSTRQQAGRHRPARRGGRAANRRPPQRNAQTAARPSNSLPRTPSRDAIIHAMRPMEQAVRGCAPNHEGTVAFQLKIRGDTGEVTSVSIDGGKLAGTDEGECMKGVVRSASFPKFTKPELEIRYPYKL
jgi:tetratricopeptide (TPR) repeat protein